MNLWVSSGVFVDFSETKGRERDKYFPGRNVCARGVIYKYFGAGGENSVCVCLLETKEFCVVC